MNIPRASLLLLFIFSALLLTTRPAEAQQKKEQYIIMLKLTPRLLDDANWTEKDNQMVSAHFKRLKGLTEAGTVVLAGRTLNSDASQFGIVIVEVESEAEARAIMEGDPAVESGVMTASLFPYQVALMRSNAK
jgi:uncharacterized protein YciI